jgi:hypothetical protein
MATRVQSLRSIRRPAWRRLTTVVVLAALLLSLQPPEPVHAETFIVDMLEDDFTKMACTSAPNDCSLRGAILRAVTTPGDDLITLPIGTYILSPDPGTPGTLWGNLNIIGDSDDLTIQGASNVFTVIDANGGATGQAAIWYDPSSGTLTLKDLKITGGAQGAIVSFGSLSLDSVVLDGNSTTASGGGIYQWGSGTTLSLVETTIRNNNSDYTGGGIYQHGGVLNITESEISGNHVTTNGPGGGIMLDAATGFSFSFVRIVDNTTPSGFGGGGITIIDSGSGTSSHLTISGNTAGADGGGLVVAGATTLTMSDDVISGNTSEKDGGGIAIGGGAAVTLERCELSANISNNATTTSTGGGGAIIISGSTLTLTNTTVSGNQAKKDGGGIMTLYGNPQVAITASTITANTPDRDGVEGGSGGGLNVYGGTVTLTGSIVADNDGVECVHDYGTLVSSGYNLASDASCELDGPGDLPSTPPKLGPLTDNGGVNLTHALLPGSPAIDAGDASYCPSTDQRGFARPMGAECDIGAYEAPVWVWLPLVFRQFP